MKTCATCDYWKRIEKQVFHRVYEGVSRNGRTCPFDEYSDSDRLPPWAKNGAVEDLGVVKTRFGYCSCVNFKYDDPVDYCLNQPDEAFAKMHADCLFYMDGENDSAWVMVGENFGCVHHRDRGGVVGDDYV